MIKVNFLVEPHYRLDRKLVRAAVNFTSQKVDLKTDAEISISVIGDRKMRQLNHQFRGKDTTTNVLSFNSSQVEEIPGFDSPETEGLYLGDIAVSYPVALKEAIDENILVDERIAFLVIHGLLHLLGMDHEEGLEALKMENLEDSIMREVRKSTVKII